MDQAFLDLLVDRLPDLEPGRPFDEAAMRYAGYYGINFSNHACQHLGRIRVDRFHLAVQVWRPARPRGSLIILHGYYDHMGLYGHIISWALQHDLAVLAFDLPGHGLSSGERASIDCFTQYQAALDGVLAHAADWELPAPWHLIGQSTGGAILIDRLLHGPLPEQLGETILMAPLVRPRQWGMSQMSLRLLGGFVQQLGRRFTDNSNDRDFLDFIRERDPLQPQVLPVAWVQALEKWIPRIESASPVAYRPLVVQGKKDGTVDWQHNIRVLEQKFDVPEVFYLDQARHHLVNEGKALRQQYLAWLAQRLGLAVTG
ncbi:alpha/beta hydrolase [Halopseudomonas nanhaiensis]|uniref:alpha/beta hydrolase n=1 Tax=Halopseudomonas nanhaiensis TaxID=2830842 RepID=UPI001CC16CF6|nr:alpha/beta hydrolase [Halopseudomonas nanhaiensis]UAW98834.1 alpha/beta hydrolase [Halopseudomonas nanhaiensis]